MGDLGSSGVEGLRRGGLVREVALARVEAESPVLDNGPLRSGLRGSAGRLVPTPCRARRGFGPADTGAHLKARRERGPQRGEPDLDHTDVTSQGLVDPMSTTS